MTTPFDAPRYDLARDKRVDQTTTPIKMGAAGAGVRLVTLFQTFATFPRDRFGLAACAVLLMAAPAPAASPCGGASRSADARVRQTLAAMTESEKLALVHGDLGAPWKDGAKPRGALGSAGYVPGIPRLGVPALQETDGPLGVANPGDIRRGDTATAMPSNLALAATWDLKLARRQGEAVGADARAKGFNVLLGGDANLIRDPRGGRDFEYFSEDPLLTGLMAGAVIDGVQANSVLSTVKHYALNDRETDRGRLDVRIDRAAARESDLLAFEIAIERGRPGAVMCAYNEINGTYACENPWLLTDVLKTDWGYRGFVLSDWGAVHSTVASALAGLDQESAVQADRRPYFASLGKAIETGKVLQARLDDMAERILRSIFACGLADPGPRTAPNIAAAEATARTIEAEGAVLLRNDGLLPLTRGLRRVLVVGADADRAVPAGGGSSQVVPHGGVPFTTPEGENRAMIYDPSSPLDALKGRMPSTEVGWDDGLDPERAAKAAAGANAVVLFVDQYRTEGADAPNLSLPGGQDRLVERVAKANPHTIVVLETGGPVLMPWLDRTAAVISAWYPGEQGGEAIADILTGVADPSGRLPATFPARDPRSPSPAHGAAASGAGDPVVRYDASPSFGYRALAERGERPLFPFGYGLSYTTFKLGPLTARVAGAAVTAALDVTNAGGRPGAAIPELYLTGPAASGVGLRLAGWSRIELAPGETRRVEIAVDPRMLATFDEAARRWRITAGGYEISAGFDATHREAAARVMLDAGDLPP